MSSLHDSHDAIKVDRKVLVAIPQAQTYTEPTKKCPSALTRHFLFHAFALQSWLGWLARLSGVVGLAGMIVLAGLVGLVGLPGFPCLAWLA